MQADYKGGRQLAREAIRFCTDLRLDFAIGACHVYKAAAEIGLRLFPQAGRSLAAYGRLGSWEEDPYFQIESLNQRARLLASQGAVVEALATQEEIVDSPEPLRPRGAYLGTVSILLAVVGKTSEARRATELARQQPSGIECKFSTSLAEAIADDVDGRHKSFEEKVTQLAIECGRARYLDGLVFAYRLYPRLLEVAQADGRSRAVVRKALAHSHDFRLAKSAGAEFRPDLLEDPLDLLTPREHDVLGLLLEGMTNAEIASRLYISHGTAKVHVRHILEKLGVRTRLQAVVRARELLEPTSN